ncbi:MAG: TonB-dependent receptor [Acidobacteriota bacterium]
MLNPWRHLCAPVISRAFLVCCLSVLGVNARSQTPSAPLATATLSGTVEDPSGAKIPHASVHIATHTATPPPALTRDTITAADGRFAESLPAGSYDVIVSVPGFDPFFQTLTLDAAHPAPALRIRLIIATQTEEVNVPATDAASTSAADNATALVFKGDDLKTFSDNDDAFQQQIIALAGGDPSAPPNIYVDGFSNGTFPPKNTIREIRINQNPFSAQYPEYGANRIEIFTKPGSDKLHGFAAVNGTANALNAPNPYSTSRPPYYYLGQFANVNGPLGKKTSFFFSDFFTDRQGSAIVNAITLGPSLAPLTVAQSISAPAISLNLSARIDRQLTTNNTFIARYNLSHSTASNSGVGLLVLPTQGVETSSTAQTLQLSDTQVIGANTVLETRFQYIRTRTHQTPADNSPSVIVQGSFAGGGSSSGASRDNQDSYEFQEYLSHSHKSHFLRAGARIRYLRDANVSRSNYNGTYIFSSLASYQLTLQNLQNKPQGTITTGPSQYSVTAGQPTALVSTADFGFYAEDEWKIRKDLTFNYGLRFESQTAIPDHFDPAPRIGLAWAVGQRDKHPAFVTLRTGIGLFYDRFASGNILTALRQNGITQTSYYIANPSTFGCTDPSTISTGTCTPTVPSTSSLSANLPTLYQLDPHLRSQYQLITMVSAERNFGKGGKLGGTNISYTDYRGEHQWLSQNINAPLPGTYNPAVPTSGTRPLGTQQNVYQFTSGGVKRITGLRIQSHYNLPRDINFYLSYAYFNNKADTSGPGSFSSNPYNPSADYGSAGTAHHRIYTSLSSKLPFGLSAYSFFSWQSHSFFNITTGSDLNGDTQYNDRPSFATSASPSASVYTTPWGTFNATPQPGETIIPINYGRASNLIYLEAGIDRGFKFGPRPPAPPLLAGAKPPKTPPPPPDRPYSINFSVEADNILNHVNPGPPVGVLTSPLFGKPNSLNGNFSEGPNSNRTISLRAWFSF